MHNSFENLQKRCKQYKLKKRAIVVIPLVIVSLGVTTFLTLDEKPKKVKQTIIKKETKVIKKEVPKPIREPKKDLKYSLKVDTTYVPKENIKITYEDYVEPVKKVKKVKKEESVKKTRAKEPKNQNIEELYVDKRKSEPLSISVTKLQSIDQMVNLYNKEKNYTLALKIAKNYYDSEQYSKALSWAKKANILDRKDDGAWIIYAKSEYAKGNHKRAIKILSLYLTNADSDEAKALLTKWKEQ